MGQMQKVGVAALAALFGTLLMAPVEDEAWAEEGRVEVRAKSEEDIGKIAAVLLGDDTAKLDPLVQEIQALEPDDLRRLIDAVRLRAGVERAPEAATPKANKDTRDIVMMETHIIEAPRALLVAALGDARPTAQLQVRPVDVAVAKQLLRQLKQAEEAKMLAAPRVLAFDGEEATVHVLSQVSYVQDYDVTVANGVSIADPIIGVLQDGLALEMHPVVSTDRQHVTVRFDGTWSELKRPIQEMKVDVGTDVPVTVQLPELTIDRIETSVTVPSGGAVVLGGERLLMRDGIAYQRIVVLLATRMDRSKPVSNEGSILDDK